MWQKRVIVFSDNSKGYDVTNGEYTFACPTEQDADKLLDAIVRYSLDVRVIG
jgi:hypothetical protein